MDKLKDYLAGGGVFEHMTDEHITPVADELDALLLIQYGQKKCGSLITTYVENDAVSDTDRQNIAKIIWLYYKEKWTRLFNFIDEDIEPWITGSSDTSITYGKTVNDQAGGVDEFARSNTIAGYDTSELTDLVDDTARADKTTYGRNDESKQSGTDSIVVNTRKGQAESLVDYSLLFWSTNGLMETVVRDVAKMLGLPVYE